MWAGEQEPVTQYRREVKTISAAGAQGVMSMALEARVSSSDLSSRIFFLVHQ